MTDAARDALIARQGPGARYDAPDAPAADLLKARRLTADLARVVNDLTDADLLVPNRAGIVATIALEARVMSEFIARTKTDAGATLGGPTHMDLDRARSLPAHALRHLFEHTRAHLNVEWREMTNEDWTRSGMDEQGEHFDLSDLPLRRAKALTRAIADLSAQPPQAPRAG